MNIFKSFGLVVLLCGVFVFAGSDKNGVNYNSGEFIINVPGNGNQPRYMFYWNDSSNSNPEYYYIRFQQMFEVDLTTFQPVPSSMIALPSLNYDWSDSEETSSGFTFNITGTPKGGKSSFDSLTFVNHLSNYTGVNNQTVAGLKFDVLLDDYEWTQPGNNTGLVFLFSFSSSSSSDSNSTASSSLTMESSSSVTSGNGFFNITPTATCGNSTINVTLNANNTAGDNQGIWLIYNYFGDCNLVHDPEFGLAKSDESGSGSGTGNGNGNGINYSTGGEFIVNVPGNGNQPRYTFYMNSSNVETYYSVRFQKMFEVDQNNSQVPSSVLSLSSVDFDWSSSSTTSSGFNFNITAGPQKNVPFNSLTLVNHLLNDSDVSDLKFDVILDGYQWVGDENSSLVLQFTLSSASSLSGASSSNTNSPLSGDSSSISSGDAFFSITPTATCGSTSIPVTLNVDSSSSNGGIWLVYSHFASTCTLVHDPEIGIETKKSKTVIWVIIAVVAGLAVVGLVVFIVKRRRQRVGYDDV